MVKEVSAMLVATTTNLEPGGGSLNTSSCFSLDRSEYKGTTCIGISVYALHNELNKNVIPPTVIRTRCGIFGIGSVVWRFL